MTGQDKYLSHIADLISAELIGNINAVEQKELNDWKNQNSENLRLYNLYRSEQFVADKFLFLNSNNIEDAYKEFSAILKKTNNRRRTLVLYRYAAALVLLLVLSGVFYWNYSSFSQNEENMLVNNILPGTYKAILTEPNGEKRDISNVSYTEIIDSVVKSDNKHSVSSTNKESFYTISVPRGGEYDLVLSDGTCLKMNSESAIRFPAKFLSDKREVFMKGEIFFDVSKDSLAPFIVHTYQGDIKVLGTSFNVRNYDDESFLETTLVDGKVVFAKDNTVKDIAPGEQLRLNKKSGEVTLEPVDVSLYCSWKDGRFVFEQQRLEIIMSTIARWYDVDIVYSEESLKDVLFTGNIKRYDDLGQIIDLLKLMNKIDIEIDGRKVLIKNR